MPTVRICEHIKDDGVRCGSPALRGHQLCFFHDREYRRHRIPANAGCKIVPVLKNERDIRIATTNVLRALRDGLLAPADLKAFLYGLQVARSTLSVHQGRNRRPKREPQQNHPTLPKDRRINGSLLLHLPFSENS